MGDFRPSRGGFGGRSGGRGSFGGGRGGFGGGRGRSFGGGRGGFGGGDRPRPEMHDATCAQCGDACQVPFKPTGEKPVLCSNCFRKSEQGSGSNTSQGSNFSPRREAPRPQSSAAPGVSQEQFKQLNVKLDKILGILENLELEVIEGEAEGDEDSEDEDSDKVLDAKTVGAVADEDEDSEDEDDSEEA
jgi:CxxC-x17-CxxC domain-containing protein